MDLDLLIEQILFLSSCLDYWDIDVHIDSSPIRIRILTNFSKIIYIHTFELVTASTDDEGRPCLTIV